MMSGLSCGTDTHPKQIPEAIRVAVSACLPHLPGISSVSIHFERNMPRYRPSGKDVEEQMYEPCSDVCDWRADERDEAEGHDGRCREQVKVYSHITTCS